MDLFLNLNKLVIFLLLYFLTPWIHRFLFLFLPKTPSSLLILIHMTICSSLILQPLPMPLRIKLMNPIWMLSGTSSCFFKIWSRPLVFLLRILRLTLPHFAISSSYKLLLPSNNRRPRTKRFRPIGSFILKIPHSPPLILPTVIPSSILTAKPRRNNTISFRGVTLNLSLHIIIHFGRMYLLTFPTTLLSVFVLSLAALI